MNHACPNYRDNHGGPCLWVRMSNSNAIGLNIKVALESNDLVQGKREIKGKTLTLLYDSGATYSFISFDCAHDLPVSDLPYVLVVSIPTDELVKTSQACLRCHFKISDRTFIVVLICLHLSGIDVILGMD